VRILIQNAGENVQPSHRFWDRLLGASLARLELVIIFEELLRRLPDMQLAAPVRRLRSNFIDGIKEMRVRFTPEPAAFAG